MNFKKLYFIFGSIFIINTTQSADLTIAVRDNNILKVLRLIKQNSYDLDQTDSSGKALLHIAAENNHFDIVRLLHEAGANIYAIDNDGNTVLHTAVNYNAIETIQYLLNHCRIDPTIMNRNGKRIIDIINQYPKIFNTDIKNMIRAYTRSWSLKSQAAHWLAQDL